MDATSKIQTVSERDVHYFRHRQKNRVFSELVAFFAAEAERQGISQRDIADRLRRDPAQISRWLSAPSNLTLDTISDLLLALEAEMDYRIVRFADRPKANAMHPLLERIVDNITPHPAPLKIRQGKGPRPPSPSATNLDVKASFRISEPA